MTDASNASDLPIAGADGKEPPAESARAGDSPHSTTATGPVASAPEGPSGYNVRAALEAGLVAGVVFLGLEVLASQFGAATPMGPARATIKGLFGLEAGQMTSGGLLGSLAVHFGLALTTTLVLAYIVHSWKPYVAAILGLAYGGLLYTANTVLFTFSAPGPTIGSGLPIITNYILFGIVAAWLYKLRQ